MIVIIGNTEDTWFFIDVERPAIFLNTLHEKNSLNIVKKEYLPGTNNWTVNCTVSWSDELFKEIKSLQLKTTLLGHSTMKEVEFNKLLHGVENFKPTYMQFVTSKSDPILN